MGIGLIATGVVNILFGFSTSLWAFALLWALNAFSRVWIAGLRPFADRTVLAYRARRLVGVMEYRAQCRRALILSLWPLSPCIMAGASG